MTPHPTGSYTILLVEDEPAVREFSRIVLESDGHTVRPIGSVTSAVATARNYGAPIHLLITDLHLPDGSGRDMIATITAIRPDIRVLIVSGSGFSPNDGRGLPPGVSFLPKPFSPSALRLRVRELMAAGSAR